MAYENIDLDGGHDYLAVNCEKTIFMKREGKEFIMYGIFVHDMKHVPTANEFLKKCSRDFEITG